MKAILTGLLLLSAAAVRGGEPAPFSTGPLRLEVPLPATSQEFDARFGPILLPVGPVRIDYGIPIPGAAGSKSVPLLDAPGPGYHQQKAKVESR